MLATVRRPVASICAALMALSLVQCTTISRRDAQEVIPPGGGEVTLKNVVGVTLTGGRDIGFESGTRAFVRGDTLHAQASKDTLAVPVSDVQRVWVKSVNGDRTTLLVIGLLAVALVGFAAFAASQIQYELP